MTGPLGDRRAERDEQRQRRAQLWTWCAEQADRVPFLERLRRLLVGWTCSARPGCGVEPTARSPTVTGSARRWAYYGNCLSQRRTSLAAFADDRLADPHALDRGSLIEGLVLDALSMRAR